MIPQQHWPSGSVCIRYPYEYNDAGICKCKITRNGKIKMYKWVNSTPPCGEKSIKIIWLSCINCNVIKNCKKLTINSYIILLHRYYCHWRCLLVSVTTYTKPKQVKRNCSILPWIHVQRIKKYNSWTIIYIVIFSYFFIF